MIRAARRSVAFAGAAVFTAAAALLAQAPPPPVLTPVPKPAAPAAPAAKPLPASQDASAVDPRLAGVPIYPGATFLQSFDLGSGQWVFVFGTNDPYAGVVTFYKGQIGKSTDVSRTPAIQQFDLGAFDSGKMTQRPSILVKDYAWPQPTDAYLHVAGTTGTRFRTLIQIIPTTK